MRRLLLLPLAVAVVGLAAFGCSKSTSPAGYGTVRVALTDAPANYDSIVLHITEVAVHRDAPDSTAGWFTVANPDSNFDLLKLQNGVFENLGSVTVPAGHYDQVRLILGSGSYIVVDGVKHDLTVPSGMQTGLKLVGGFDVASGGETDIGIDFDAAHSVHETGNGKWMLKPVVHIREISTTGTISGVVSPADPKSSVFALVGADTLSSTMTGSNGAFALTLLPAGTYNVAIDAPDAFHDTTLTGVAVTAGQTHDVGTVTLTPVAMPQ